MPLLLVFAASDQPLGTIANSEVVAVEIVRTLCGSIGLVAAVPVTTIMAAVLVGTTSSRAPRGSSSEAKAKSPANPEGPTATQDSPRTEDSPRAEDPSGPGAPDTQRTQPKPSWDDFGPIDND